MEASPAGTFGIRQPSLIQQLKSVLDQYPDDGQILKELIQNAEDAGASKVKFLCDYHRYGTEKLHHPELDKFQGPALYAYNDEMFTDNDWEGIQDLCVSIKAKDPMKVGRFGLGFKSVYHITDLPSIVSGTHLGMFDPHETYFGERTTGHRWCFNQDRETVDLIPDQFAPHEGIFECGTECIRADYKGTLFRFPLRESPSRLSDNLYSPEKVCERFESFQIDAHLVLLFLNSIESIEFYVREEEESTPRKTFEVKIDDSTLEEVRAKRKEFMNEIKHLKKGEVPSNSVSVTYLITVECTSYKGHEGFSNLHFYLLTNYICGEEVVAEVKTLSEDLSYLPRVGVAIPLDEQAETAEDPTGHLFCFLPLPMQKKSLTGLPVHVNGFFALSQNRHYLKWPTTDQEEGGKELTDKALLWNKFLVKEVVHHAYADLLLESRNEVSLEVFYKAWPDPVKTDPKWQEMLPPLFEQLLHRETFYTTANGGAWLKIEDAIFDTLDRRDLETRQVILNALQAANTRVVSAPCHVMDVISKHHGEIAVITPKRVREILRRTPSCYRSFQRSEKLLLLKYILEDLPRSAELDDLELLPLSSGQFTRFLRTGPSCESIYISSKDHEQALLPGLDNLFVDSSIEEGILVKLKTAATHGHPQLKHLDENAVITLLPRSFPGDWSSGDQVTWYPGNEGHPPQEWLELVWRYLSQHFPRDLSEFENLPLIPVDRSENTVTLAKLHRPSALVLQSSSHGSLDGIVVEVLQNLGITIVSELPVVVRSHPAILEYICLPLVSSVLQAMVTQFSAGYTNAEVQLQRQSIEYKRALRSFIAKAPVFSLEVQELVQHLPLFETLQGSGSRASRFVTSRKICTAAPKTPLPVKVLTELIDISHSDSETLARLSGVNMLKTTELLDRFVFPGVREGEYSEDDINELMKHVFEHYSEYKKEMPKFPNAIKDLHFVPRRDGERVKPSDLFDPIVTYLQNILAGEDVFPSGPVYTQLGALGILRELGLKKERKDLTACDVLKSVCHTEKMAKEGKANDAQGKARAILEHLNENIQMMRDIADGEPLGNVLRRHSWIPTMTAGRPPSYPENLPFCIPNDAHLLKPTELTSSDFVHVIGTVKPVVRIEDNCLSNIAEFFEWTKAPDTEDVIEHLTKVVEFYNQAEKETYMSIIKKVYQHLHYHPCKITEALSKLQEQKWIWNGDGFSSPQTMVFEKPFTDLTPYICPLPSEVSKFKDVFMAGGMKEESKTSLLLRVLELIKEKYDKEGNHKSADVEHDLQLSSFILKELKPSPGKCLEEEVKARLLIPTDVMGDSTLRLALVSECTYCDNEWLQQGRDTSDLDEDGDIILYVHREISNDTADSLGVPSLMSRIVDADELDVGEELGQEEPLTRSINRLLEGYTDGFAVPKELIQNADDAGATEVKFLYDERTNEDCMTCLFDEGMKACQGPALWAYNNAVFTDKDFSNITKLNEATKERDTEKIGRFGSGFNAVYNLTDVPSFVSRSNFALFDPHKTHLGKAIKNGKPGIKIDLKKNKKKLRKLANQFKPFNGIFGCDLGPETGQDSYEGTLFRFPLRTKEEAVKSDLKKLHYNNEEMRQLLNKLVSGAESLLLFTQTVCVVSVYHLPRNSSGKPQPLQLFKLRKSPIKVIRSLSFVVSPTVKSLTDQERRFAEQSSFLRASSCALKLKTPKDFPKSSMIIDVKMKHTKEGATFFGFDEDKSCSWLWLVSSAMGTESALKFARKDETLVPTAGVAVRLSGEVPGIFLPEPIMDPNNSSKHSGKLFCYLPLPCESCLPVHVNGFFALASNRRHLKEKTEDDKRFHEVDWNKILMEDSVLEAYISALEDLREFLPNRQESSDIYNLWPRLDMASSTCQPIVQSFYGRLAGPNSPMLFSDGDHWVSLNQVLFLDPALRSHHEVGNIAFQVFRDYKPHSEVVVDLPPDVMKSFIDCGYERTVNERRVSRENFFRDIFLRNITKISPDQRDPLTLYALDDDNLGKLLKDVACIPVSPKGQNLKRPRELIHPRGDASVLYSLEDERFPFGTKETFLNPARLEKLVEELCMWNDCLGWEEVIERAQSVQALNTADNKGALERTRALIQFLDKKLTAEEQQPQDPAVKERLRNAKFLPILSKPKTFPFKWVGEEYGPSVLLAPKDVFQKKMKNLVSCTWPILDDHPDGCGRVPDKVEELLGFKEKTVCLDDVKTQLETAIVSQCAMENIDNHEEKRKVFRSIYEYLQKYLDQNREEILHFLEEKKFILGEAHLLSANQVAFDFQVDCPPYLFRLPKDLASSFSDLLREAGVRQTFDIEDYIRTLHLFKRRFKDDILDDDNLKLTADLAMLIDSCGQGKRIQLHSDIYLPDAQKRLCPSSALCVKDDYWMPDEEEVNYVHPMIPQETCIHLGVNTKREQTLRKCSIGLAFGQREELTTRLKHILTAYPSENEILRELLQNADDSRATEICFIKDPRQHGEERVFEEIWKPLQGPALCVYNNQPFTEADIAGIQNLGEGSKGDDPNKTGQYGVGFNAVYHLTDAPSFLSKGNEIGEVLCVFDPHCTFVPGATSHEPGRKYTDINKLRGKFPDVFSCYLEEHFTVDNATMFRFPLRNTEMADNSRICDTPTTIGDLEEMMAKFESEMFEALLFVNCVKKISLCEVEEDGNLTVRYEVSVEISEEDAKKRTEFSKHVTNVGTKLRKKEITLPEMHLKEVSYVVDLKDNKGYQEKWLVVQRIGFEPGVEVPESLLKTFRNGDLTLLPRGGVASLLPSSDKNLANKAKKPFCFLPLPFETGLPVHVNGHFALDHESRRNLWRDENGGHRTDWNETLLAGIIAPCYVSLLCTVRHYLQLHPGSDGITKLKGNIRNAKYWISQYMKLFPSLDLQGPYWVTLSKEVYRYLAKQGAERLLPVARGCSQQGHEQTKLPGKQETGFVEISWLPPSREGKDKAFFNNLRDFYLPKTPQFRPLSYPSGELKPERLKTILLDSGFNVVESPFRLYRHFLESGVDVRCISPRAVLGFFGSYSTRHPFCRLRDLPQAVKDTPLKDVGSVELLLDYCSKDKDFLVSLEGLPLLVTEDETLRVFDWFSPPFLSGHVDVLPMCDSEFVHRRLYNRIFRNVDVRKQGCFKAFDVTAMANRLHNALPASDFFKVNSFVDWNPDSGMPSTLWISQVWKFLNNETQKIIKDEKTNASVKCRLVSEKLWPLTDWCLLPARDSSLSSLPQPVAPSYLVPISMAETVIDFEADHLMSDVEESALKVLGIPEPYLDVMGRSSPARLLLATPNRPRQVLKSLLRKLETLPFKTAVQTEHDEILEYFSKHVDHLKPEDSNLLKQLPFYCTATGELTNLTGKTVFVLPESDSFPKVGMAEWQTTGAVFLKMNSDLSCLYDVLDCESLTEVNLYCRLILPHIKDMIPEDRIAHLEHVRTKTLRMITETDKGTLIANLQKTCFLPDRNGDLQKASFFYDPEEPVFKEMLSVSMFPPEPFSSDDEWLKFLREIGLIYQVTEKQLVSFAEQIAKEARRHASNSTQAKSEVLLRHLFARPNLAEEGLLERICHIPFICPHKAYKDLRHVHRQYGMEDNGTLPYICFNGAVRIRHEYIVWTSANILPVIADPHEYGKCGNIEEITDKLKILEDPKKEQVISHCENVCRKFFAESDNCSSIIIEVMRKIYSFLQNHLSCEMKSRLQHIPCALVEDGGRLVLPCQMVAELMTDQEIKPYLYKIPLEFGQFHKLFVCLGSTRVATTEQYAMVLKEIYSKTESGNLQLEERKKCFMAVKGFFEKLEKANFQPGVLFLPGHKKDESDKIVLRESASLVLDNAPHFRERIAEFDEMLLVDLKQCGLNATNFEVFVNMLPNMFRPRMLTSLVQECLTEQVSEAPLQEKAEDLRQLLRSRQFSRAIVRLIRHGDHAAGLSSEHSNLMEVKRSLTCIRVYGTDVLETQLLYQGKVIPGSTKEISCFANEIVDGNSKIWNIYLATSGGYKKTWRLQVADIVNRITGGLLKDMLLYLPILLTVTPREISSTLDSFGIREDRSHDVHQPGTPIPIEDHCLLEYAFEVFEHGECVGYERNAQIPDCEDDDSLYIYAVILEEISARTVSCLKKTYRINIGEETIEASAIDLYKLQDESQPSKPKTLEEATKEITRLVEEALTFPKQTRGKIIKRLYLTWQLDKNPGNEMVLHFLRREIARMEPSYSSFFSNWDRHAERHCAYTYPTSPRPHEARRWFRQAEADLRAAANDLREERSSFEWACFKCHQAAEKALKAAQYSKHGNKLNSHRLSDNACELGSPSLEDLARELDRLLVDSTAMRYPDMLPNNQVPNDVYDHDMALRAQEFADSILEEVKSLIFFRELTKGSSCR